MKTELKTILAALVMIISSIAGCIEETQDPTPDESDGNDGADGLNETANQTVDNNTDNNTGNNIDNNTGNNTDNNTDNNTGNNTDNNTGNNTDPTNGTDGDIDYLIAGTDDTTYVAWINDWTMVTANITTQNLDNSTEYNVTWFLHNDTDGDGVVDFLVNSGVWPNVNQAVLSNTFPVRGPNMAFGLIEGWYCFEAHLWVSSGAINGSIDSDTACFDVVSPSDVDGDGFSGAADCNDSNAAINPNATDIWNGIDDDCDGVIDPFMDRSGNASFDLYWESLGWVIKNKSSAYEGHTLYWLGNTYFAYRFLASPDVVFANGTPCTIGNIGHSPNIVATLTTLGLSSDNISLSMTTMDLGTDTEEVEWSYDSNTSIETRYYDGGTFIFKLDGQEFMNLSIGFTEYLNYSQYYSGEINPNVTMTGYSDVGQMVNGIENTSSDLWRIAEAFVIDFNGTIDFTFGSQDAIIQQHYNTDEGGAVELGVNLSIAALLNCGAGGGSCPNWIAAEFTNFAALAASEN